MVTCSIENQALLIRELPPGVGAGKSCNTVVKLKRVGISATPESLAIHIYCFVNDVIDNVNPLRLCGSRLSSFQTPDNDGVCVLNWSRTCEGSVSPHAEFSAQLHGT